ncbi:hypothetical protein Desaci_0388 [Desulfosporosinus acidiphilus SJ4]|uniref:ABC-2 family transporter protein n=1 Tax=Desulfosporosinus acidiphilus (strain DSM 22704 / JCM 16185 / SJ4) TaxID=646529 RepID=I4D0Y1_DESAJ|nr:hypothetical protein [Desulfosporosinus acidiphilus]AFM39455.1 hypothetical protein Desaci_0388 [Desulfosporosinus acidiphilus SJ4]
MLTKLLKYEIKATGRMFLPIFLSLLVFAVINKILSVFDNQSWQIPSKISMVFYVIIMAGMFVMTLTVMIQRFYKNLLSDEGYLMYTLPVKSWKHILSKLLVSMLWMIASVIAAMISIEIISYKQGTLGKIIQGLAVFHNQVTGYLGAPAYLLILELILGGLITLASGILMVYTSIAIGHLFSRHKIIVSFGAFIALNTITQIYIILACRIPKIVHSVNIVFYNVTSNDFFRLELIFMYGLILIGIPCASYFAATNFILSKRLNLE